MSDQTNRPNERQRQQQEYWTGTGGTATATFEAPNSYASIASDLAALKSDLAAVRAELAEIRGMLGATPADSTPALKWTYYRGTRTLVPWYDTFDHSFYVQQVKDGKGTAWEAWKVQIKSSTDTLIGTYPTADEAKWACEGAR